MVPVVRGVEHRCKSIQLNCPLKPTISDVNFPITYMLGRVSDSQNRPVNLLLPIDLAFSYFYFSEGCLLHSRCILTWSPRGTLSFLCARVSPPSPTTPTSARWNGSSSASSPPQEAPSSPRASSFGGNHATSWCPLGLALKKKNIPQPTNALKSFNWSKLPEVSHLFTFAI